MLHNADTIFLVWSTPLLGISLGKSNSPTLWNTSCPTLQSMYCQGLLQELSLTGSWQWRLISGIFGTFADLPPVWVLWGLKCRPGSPAQCIACSFPHAPRPSIGSHKQWIADSSKQVARASHKQHLTLACTRIHPKRPRINTPRGHLQTATEQGPISFTGENPKGDLGRHQVLLGEFCSVHSSLHIVLGVSLTVSHCEG